MAQSRKRIFLVMVRDDLVPHSGLVHTLGEVINKVLPHAFDSYSPSGSNLYGRETVQQIRAYTHHILSQMGMEQGTQPPQSQDYCEGVC